MAIQFFVKLSLLLLSLDVYGIKFQLNVLVFFYYFNKSINLSFGQFNPLVPCVLNIGRLAKILISLKEGILKKNSMSFATMSR